MHLAICWPGVHSTGHILALLSPWHGPMYTTRIWHLGEWVDHPAKSFVDMVEIGGSKVCFWALGCLSEQECEARGLNTLKVEVAAWSSLCLEKCWASVCELFFCCKSSSHLLRWHWEVILSEQAEQDFHESLSADGVVSVPYSVKQNRREYANESCWTLCWSLSHLCKKTMICACAYMDWGLESSRQSCDLNFLGISLDFRATSCFRTCTSKVNKPSSAVPLKVQIQKAKASVPEDRANIMRLVDPDVTEVGVTNLHKGQWSARQARLVFDLCVESWNLR